MEVPVKSGKLPKEILVWEILSKLPTKSLIRFKSVSKEWLDVITNDAVLKRAHARHHLARSSGEISVLVLAKKKLVGHKLFLCTPQDFQELDLSYMLEKLKTIVLYEVDLIGSSNGLVLLFWNNWLILWNPATRKFRFLRDKTEGYDLLVFDLGFDEERDDHKVLRVCDSNSSKRELNFQVFSKRAGSWTDLEPLSGFGLRSFPHGRVSIRGTFYFLAVQFVPDEINPKIVIVSFTYENDKVRRVIDAPPCDGAQFRLGKWEEDSLALIAQNQENEVYDFYVLVKNGENGFSWFKLFVFNRCYGDDVQSDRILMIQRPGKSSGDSELALWDPQTAGDQDSCFVISKLERHWYFRAAINHFPTLFTVSPDPL